eukprot:13595-Chlamydomonas_euryale.AAC.1
MAATPPPRDTHTYTHTRTHTHHAHTHTHPTQPGSACCAWFPAAELAAALGGECGDGGAAAWVGVGAAVVLQGAGAATHE